MQNLIVEDKPGKYLNDMFYFMFCMYEAHPFHATLPRSLCDLICGEQIKGMK